MLTGIEAMDSETMAPISRRSADAPPPKNNKNEATLHSATAPLAPTSPLKLIRILEEFRKAWEFFPVHVMELFIQVASASELGKPLSVTEAVTAVGDTNLATVSRNLRVLAQACPGRGGGVAVALVETVQDPLDYRARRIVLTPAGRALYYRIMGKL